jgi:carboxylate-amine ligase
MRPNGYRFGLEGEYLLVETDSFRPLWHPDLRFQRLNQMLEGIDFAPLLDGLPLDGLELDPPHRKLMPYYVEGYGVPDTGLTSYVDILPKGIEVRTPVCPDLETCLLVYENLYQGLQQALANEGLRALGIGHHPLAWDFWAPQNHKRHDWWQWALRVITTYGPDMNLSVPDEFKPAFDWEDLQRRANYYGPALVAFSLNSPIKQGCLWRPRGVPGFSLRSHRRSPFGPMLAYHPKEGGRVEFKSFDMPGDRRDFRLFFLLWLWLTHDTKAPGRAEDQDRVYDLGALARFGWEADEITARAEEALDRASPVLSSLDVDPSPLQMLRLRMNQRWMPALPLMQHMESADSISGLSGSLRHLDQLGETPTQAPWNVQDAIRFSQNGKVKERSNENHADDSAARLRSAVRRGE